MSTGEGIVIVWNLKNIIEQIGGCFLREARFKWSDADLKNGSSALKLEFYDCRLVVECLVELFASTKDTRTKNESARQTIQ